MKLVTGVVLFLWAVEDGVKKEISIWRLVIGSIIMLVAMVLRQNIDWMDSVAGASIGVSLLLYGHFKKETIGAGDGVVFLIIGITCGFMDTFRILSMSLLLLVIVSVQLLILRKITLQTQMAFLPYVFFGYVGCCLW